MVKEIEVFTVEAYAEEEDYRVYFTNKDNIKPDREKFDKDVRETIVEILNEKYSWVKIDDKTFIRRRAVENKKVKKFLECLREKHNYNGIALIDFDGCIKYYVEDDELMSFDALEDCYQCSLPMFFGSRVLPSKIIESDEFEKKMEERGWEKVNIKSKYIVSFYEYGGFVQGDNGKWYNHVWNSGYYDVLTDEKYETIKNHDDSKDDGDE